MRLPLLGELPVVIVIVEMVRVVMLVLGLHLDRYGHLDRLHNCLRMDMCVMLHWNVDSHPVEISNKKIAID